MIIRNLKLLILISFLILGAVLISRYTGPTDARPLGIGNQPPEISDLKYSKIGVGQRLTFGLEVIDEEADPFRIELIKKPAGAKFNQNTLTVDWTPSESNGSEGVFEIRVTELSQGNLDVTRTVTKRYRLAIVKEKVKLKKLPPTTIEVDSFVSIIDPDRLKAAKKRWDILSFFQRAAEIEADKQIGENGNIRPATGIQLFRDSLKQLAVLHKNPEVDPDNRNFNPVWKAEHWDLIAVRPRINKKVFELRLVYFNETAAEQAYLMPRMRITRGDDARWPDELRQKNNMAFIKMFHEAFFDGAEMRDFVRNDKTKYGEALAEFIARVLNFRDPEEPLMRANFAALPHNSRLGGGNAYDQDGKYLHGDGWLLGTLKIEPVSKGGIKRLAVTSPPLAGFVASIKPKNGKHSKSRPPVTDPKSPDYKKGWEELYDDGHGTVHVPNVSADGSVSKSNIDTTLVAREYKFGQMVAETALRDPRRRLFEEKGMTCIQCHVRNFDEGDYLRNVKKAGEEEENTVTRPIPRVFFIITPSLHNGRNEYIHREEQEQVANLQGVIRDYLGIRVNIAAPLSLDWVHNTKNGRS